MNEKSKSAFVTIGGVLLAGFVLGAVTALGVVAMLADCRLL